MTLMRWNPYREMRRLRDEFDRLFDGSLDLPGWDWPGSTGEPAVDVAENEQGFVIKASLPGIKAQDLDISVSDNLLTIKGEVKDQETSSDGQYHLRERRYGAFSRTVTLPAPVEVDSVEATFEDGVLTLNAPKTEDVRRKRIPIQDGSGS